MNRTPTATTSRATRALNVPRAALQRAKRSNDPLAHIDRRSAEGRRIADLARDYSESLGHPTDVTRLAQIIRAAELVALAEKVRAAALRDPSASTLDATVRAENLAARAVRQLGIKGGPKSDASPSLADILARHREPK